MSEKESRFFRKENLSEKKELKDKKKIWEKYIGEGEKLLARKKGVTPEQKTSLICRYSKNTEDILYRLNVNDGEKEKVGNYFKNLTYEKLEKIMGKQETALVAHVITAQEKLFQQMEKNGANLSLVLNLVKQKGKEMLPLLIRKSCNYLYFSQSRYNELFEKSWILKDSLDSQSQKKIKETKENAVRDLKALLVEMEKESQKWQKHQKFERKKEEKPIKILGFETFNFPRIIKGNEIMEKAVKILPRGLFSTNIRKIKCCDIQSRNQEEYGFKSEEKSFAEIISYEKTGKCDILFFEHSFLTRIEYLEKAPLGLAHEFGHSLDPRVLNQKDLTPKEQLRMIIEWEDVREKEKEWSDWVLKIKHQNKKQKEVFKSEEGFAESVALYLNSPERLQNQGPQRYKFLDRWLKKRFPDFDNLKTRTSYVDYINLIKRLIRRGEF